jgi:hypothetical protein
LALAVNVSVELVPVTVMGLKPAVTPAGSVGAERVTAPLKPFVRLTVTVRFALPPAVTAAEDGQTVME